MIRLPHMERHSYHSDECGEGSMYRLLPGNSCSFISEHRKVWKDGEGEQQLPVGCRSRGAFCLLVTIFYFSIINKGCLVQQLRMRREAPPSYARTLRKVQEDILLLGSSQGLAAPSNSHRDSVCKCELGLTPAHTIHTEP